MCFTSTHQICAKSDHFETSAYVKHSSQQNKCSRFLTTHKKMYKKKFKKGVKKVEKGLKKV